MDICLSDGSPAPAASLAAFVALSSDEHADGASPVCRATHASLVGSVVSPSDAVTAPVPRRLPEAAAAVRAIALAGSREQFLSYPYCSDDAIDKPSPEIPAEKFAPDVDVFFRRLIADRLCRLWTTHPSDEIPWPATRHQVLLPFACYVAGRACTDRTRDQAELILPSATVKLITAMGRPRRAAIIAVTPCTSTGCNSTARRAGASPCSA
jgi:hypothetical protein